MMLRNVKLNYCSQKVIRRPGFDISHVNGFWTRNVDSATFAARMSVRPFIRPSVCHTYVSRLTGLRYRNMLCIVA